MNEKKESAAKIVSVLRASVVLSLVSIGALYIYATYISPSARENFLSSLALILLTALSASLATSSLLYLSARIKTARPAAAHNLMPSFFIVTILYLLLPRTFGYSIESRQIIIYLLLWLGLSLALHGVVSMRKEG